MGCIPYYNFPLLMKNYRAVPAFFAASLLAFITPAFAGPTTLDFDADPAITDAGASVLGDGEAFTQTFTGVGQINDITFGFVVADSATFGPLSLDAYFTSWDGSNSDGLLVESFNISLANSASWTNQGNGFLTFNAEFNLGSLALNPLSTYGLTFVGNADTDSNNIRLAAAGNAYLDGAGFFHSGPIAAAGDLLAGGAAGYSLGFVATDTSNFAAALTPIPEAGTAAVAFAGMFIGLMLTRRKYRPRSLTAANA
jgi:hypothetical protein